MRKVLLFVLCTFSFPALAYDVTATMPDTSGADGCRLYMDGVEVGTGACGVPVTFPGLVTDPGTYDFTYTLFNAAGESAQSPVRTVNIGVIDPPVDPTEPPTISIACDPEPCPASITIVITP